MEIRQRYNIWGVCICFFWINIDTVLTIAYKGVFNLHGFNCLIKTRDCDSFFPVISTDYIWQSTSI